MRLVIVVPPAALSMANGPPLAAIILRHVFGSQAGVDVQIYDGNLRFLKLLERPDVSEEISTELLARIRDYLGRGRLEHADLTEIGRLFTFLSYEQARSDSGRLSRFGIEWAAVSDVVLDEKSASGDPQLQDRVWKRELCVLADDILALKPDHLAFTTLFHEQFKATAALGRQLRGRGFAGRIIVGGAATKVARDALLRGLLNEAGVDLVYTRNVHTTPRSLLRYLDGESAPQQVEDAVFADKDGTLVRTGAAATTRQLVGAMDYELEPSAQYFAERTFPVLLSEGCYWGKCDFCDYPYLASQDPFLVHATFRKPADVVADVNTIARKSLASRIDLISDAVPLGYFSRLLDAGAGEFRDRSLRLECSIRAERHATAEHFRTMALAGVDSVTIGMEALSDEVLLLMHKGNTFADIERCVDFACAAGIKVKANLIVDHPHIGAEHVPEMISRLGGLLPKLSAIGVHSFSLSPYAPIAFDLPRARLALAGDDQAIRTDHGGHTLSFTRLNDGAAYREAISRYRSAVEAASFELDRRGQRLPGSSLTIRLPYRWCGDFAAFAPVDSDLVLSVPGERAPFRYFVAEREDEGLVQG